jgi:hypothetical protein
MDELNRITFGYATSYAEMAQVASDGLLLPVA